MLDQANGDVVPKRFWVSASEGAFSVSVSSHPVPFDYNADTIKDHPDKQQGDRKAAVHATPNKLITNQDKPALVLEHTRAEHPTNKNLARDCTTCLSLLT